MNPLNRCIFISCLIAPLFLAGCVATPPSRPEATTGQEVAARQFRKYPDSANLYVARAIQFGASNSYRITANGEEIGHLNAGEFMNLRATPGRHTFHITDFATSYQGLGLNWRFSVDFDPGAVAVLSCGLHSISSWQNGDRRLLPDAACESGGSYRRHAGGGIQSCSIPFVRGKTKLKWHGVEYDGDDIRNCRISTRVRQLRDLDMVQALAGTISNTEYTEYQSAKQTNTIEAYQAYLTKYPRTEHRKSIETTIAGLKRKQEEDAWQRAITSQRCPPAMNDYVYLGDSCAPTPASIRNYQAEGVEGTATVVNIKRSKQIRGEFSKGFLQRGALIDKKEGLIYEGEWRTMTTLQKEKPRIRFWNYYEGQGKLFEKGKLVYHGEFKGGKRHGKGMCRVERGMEPCELKEGRRVDALYVLRKEKKKLEQQTKICRSNLAGLKTRAEIIAEWIQKPICPGAYQKVANTSRDRFSLDLYDGSRSIGNRPIKMHVAYARSCRNDFRKKLDERLWLSGGNGDLKKMREAACPQSQEAAVYDSHARELLRDFNARMADLESLEADYLRLDQKLYAAGVRRNEKENAAYWAGLAKRFSDSVFDSQMKQTMRQTQVVIGEAYAEQARRKAAEAERRRQEALARANSRGSSAAQPTKTQLGSVNQKISAAERALTARIAEERERCLRRPGNQWNARGNSCRYHSTVQVQGWKSLDPAVVQRAAQPTAKASSGKYSSGYLHDSGSTPSDPGGPNRPDHRGGSTVRQDSAMQGWSAPAGSSTGTGGSTGSQNGTAGVGSADTQAKGKRTIPVFIDKEGNFSWSTKEEACKYAQAAAERAAEKRCKAEFGGRRARKSEVVGPVANNMCHSYREMTGLNKGNWKVRSKTSLQCILPDQPVANPIAPGVGRAGS